MLINQKVEYDISEDPLSVIFAALADPTRRAILAKLTQGEANVNDLAAPFDLSLPAISKHLKVLEHAGLISRGRKAQWRPCRLETQALKEAFDWVGGYRQFWDDNLSSLDSYLRRVQAQETRAKKSKGGTK